MLQFGLSRMPHGERLNYAFQRYGSKSLPTSDTQLADIVAVAKQHIDLVTQFWHRPLVEAAFYEFGAGVTLEIPLVFYALGVGRQITVDIKKLVRPGLVNDIARRLQRLGPELTRARKPEGELEEKDSHCFTKSLKRRYGIEYQAPCDARVTGLPSASVDIITSTNTLEHIPPKDIQAILFECRRILRDDGLMSFRIDYQDHYSYTDSRISVYNFLQYSDRHWSLYSPALQYQNRLRHRDYVELFQAGGFVVMEEKRRDGTRADMEIIEGIPLHKKFREYKPEELAVHDAFILLRKRVL